MTLSAARQWWRPGWHVCADPRGVFVSRSAPSAFDAFTLAVDVEGWSAVQHAQRAPLPASPGVGLILTDTHKAFAAECTVSGATGDGASLHVRTFTATVSRARLGRFAAVAAPDWFCAGLASTLPTGCTVSFSLVASTKPR